MREATSSPLFPLMPRLLGESLPQLLLLLQQVKDRARLQMEENQELTSSWQGEIKENIIKKEPLSDFGTAPVFKMIKGAKLAGCMKK